MKEITATNGCKIQVDDADYMWLAQWKWSAGKSCYTKCATRTTDKILMHRLIMDTPADLVVDHIDGNGLNNQRHNLRNCTQSQNKANSKSRFGNKGVYAVSNIYTSKIMKDGKSIYLGCFKTEEEATFAYNKAAVELFGEFAYTNRVEEATDGGL